MPAGNDFCNNQLINAVAHHAGADEERGIPAAGKVVFRTDTLNLEVCRDVDPDPSLPGGGTWGPVRVGYLRTTQTDDYTLALTDAEGVVELNKSTAIELTVPADADVDFPLGTQIDVVQVGTGQASVVGDTGVTVNSFEGSLALAGQWAGATLYKRGADDWVLIGNLE